MGPSHHKDKVPRIQEISPGFFNIRGSFKILKGLIDVGTHMSLIRLSTGKFLVLDTIPLDDQLKEEIDELTEDGTLIEAVLALHPFHTLAFNGFYDVYPDADYYGCPRHLRVLEDIPWAGEFRDDDVETLKVFEPEVELRIPRGAEFVDPKPEASNHFSSVLCFHVESRTVHVDDTIMNYEGAGFILNNIVGKKGLQFHPSLSGPGLHYNCDAPWQFKNWVNEILEDWDFENMCVAHCSNVIGDAKEKLRECLEDHEEKFVQLSENYEKRAKKEGVDINDEDYADKFNVEGDNCG